jgi:hypothetical protein
MPARGETAGLGAEQPLGLSVDVPACPGPAGGDTGHGSFGQKVQVDWVGGSGRDGEPVGDGGRQQGVVAGLDGGAAAGEVRDHDSRDAVDLPDRVAAVAAGTGPGSEPGPEGGGESGLERGVALGRGDAQVVQAPGVQRPPRPVGPLHLGRDRDVSMQVGCAMRRIAISPV